ncbi:MAG: carbohydrate ABC transporter permease [Actinomycetota bacterium]
MSRRTREAVLGWCLLAPSAVVFGAFVFYPLYRLVDLGLHEKNRFGTAERYVGLSQYSEVLSGEEFRSGLSVTIRFVLLTVPVGIVLGIVLAVAANRHLRGIKVFQTIFSSTVASSVAVASVIFLVLVNPQIGLFGDVRFLSLAHTDSALRGIALSAVWANLGLTFIIVLAALQAVPEEIDEAAALDGYGPIRKLFRITVPLISPTLLFLVVVLVIIGFQAFGQVEILTGGGPAGATETLVYKIFNKQQPLDQGEGAVMAIGLFGITFVVSLLQIALLERRVHYGG